MLPVLDKAISEFGTPIEIKTDNGPPFTSENFQKYMDNMGIIHRKITPNYP